ncbi:alpha/beta fold hydrolase [Sphingomonas sp. RS2018]
MGDYDLQSVPLATGMTLTVAVAGDPSAPPIILLHGFPESHRTWRGVIPDLARDHFVLAPDQRGFAGSSKPDGVENYTPDKPVADLLALADHFGIDRFTLVGHDWGGAIAWMAALQNPTRIERLVIVNAPHPFVFQKSLIEDAQQRAASQYIRAFRTPGIEDQVSAMGMEAFFDTTFARHADVAELEPGERERYIADWSQPGALTAMLNWYRASAVQVPGPEDEVERPAFLDAPFPPVTQPTLVIWGLRDVALLPIQLEGLDALVPDLTVTKVDAGHFVPWENAPAVVEAMRAWGI